MNVLSPRSAAILREIGLGPLWRLRTGSVDDEGEDTATVTDTHDPVPAMPAARAAATASSARDVSPRLAPMVERLSDRLSGRNAEARPVVPAAVTPGHEAASGAASQEQEGARAQREARIATLDWEALEQTVRDCRACGLCEQRKQAVPGVGDRKADWLLVGEGPGAEEDRKGEPFVGPAGKLLDAMLHAIGLERGKGVYIANSVKCRPPLNRTPESHEIAACLPFLRRQIDLLQPKIIVALGRPAAQALLNEEVRISAARGRRFTHADIPVVVTYHPAYLLRNPADKRKAWEDLCFARSLVSGQTEAHSEAN